MSDEPVVSPTPPASEKEKPAGQQKPKLNTPESKTTAEGDFLEIEILAQCSSDKVAEKIAKDIAVHVNGKQVILMDASLAAAISVHESMLIQLEVLKRGFDDVMPGAAPAPPGGPKLATAAAIGLAAAATSALDMLSLFRQDTSLTANQVTISDTAFQADLAHHLRASGATVYHPRLVPYKPAVEIQASRTKIVSEFETVYKARSAAHQRLKPKLDQVIELERELAKKEAEHRTAPDDKKPMLEKEIQSLKDEIIKRRKILDPDLIMFENLTRQLDKLQTSLTTPDKESGNVPMQVIQRAAEIVSYFKDAGKPVLLLFAQVVAAGGARRIRRHIFSPIIGDDGLEFSGGGAACYHLFDGEAKLIASRTHRHVTDFQKPKAQDGGLTSFNTTALS